MPWSNQGGGPWGSGPKGTVGFWAAVVGWKFQPIDETRALEIELVYNNKR